MAMSVPNDSKEATLKGSDALVEMLKNADVRYIFGLCGDTSLPFYESLYDSGEGITHVLTRDERSAGYMADAYARLSGRVGVCEGPSGGGATYLLPGVAEANGSFVPLIAITTDIDAREAGKAVLTEFDQKALFEPVTKEAFFPAHSEQLPHIVRRAFKVSTTGSLGATHITLPFNVQTGGVKAEDSHIDSRYGSYPAYRPLPSPNDVQEVAKYLIESKRPLVVAGAGVLRSEAWAELTQLAELLGAPVATSVSGKGSIAETHPYALGVIGSNGGLAYRHEFVRKADLVFFIGCSTSSVTTEKWTLPAVGETKVLQLDINGAAMGRNYPLDASIAADAKLGLQALVDVIDTQLAGKKANKVDAEELRRARDRHMASVDSLFDSSDSAIRPERFLRELFQVMPADSIVLADPGTPCPYVSAYWRLPKAGRWFISPRANGALGYSLPGVVGAYYARPEAGRIIGIMGDGSFGVSAGELETIARLNIPVTLVVMSNSSYGWIKAGQKSRGGKFYSVDFGETDHAAVARAFGLTADRVEKAEDLAAALEKGMTHDGPILVDIVTQALEETNAPVSKWIA
jgi:acetolactate synthase-1/2/3 large subunit